MWQSSVCVKAEKMSRDIVDQNFWTSQCKQVQETGQMQQVKMMSLSKSIKKLFTKLECEEVVPFQHPFREECKADFHAACR